MFFFLALYKNTPIGDQVGGIIMIRRRKGLILKFSFGRGLTIEGGS